MSDPLAPIIQQVKKQMETNTAKSLREPLWLPHADVMKALSNILAECEDEMSSAQSIFEDLLPALNAALSAHHLETYNAQWMGLGKSTLTPNKGLDVLLIRRN